MSRRAADDRTVATLRRLAGAARREGERSVFVDGLVIGVMVGAAIAGSTLWSRWQGRRRAQPLTDGESRG